MDVLLTDFEIALFDSISFPPASLNLDDARAADNAELARILTTSILERDAVPRHRLDYFEDAVHNFGQAVSMRTSLEQAGVSGEALYEDARFLKYLRYFICGPELPEKIANVFRKELAERGGVAQGDHRRLIAKLRQLASALGASDDQREKFYQQALEFDLAPHIAREISDALVVAS